MKNIIKLSDSTHSEYWSSFVEICRVYGFDIKELRKVWRTSKGGPCEFKCWRVEKFEINPKV